MKTGTPKSRTVKVNGLVLHYLEWGTPGKQQMLLLHGFMGHAHIWDSLAAIFSRDYHVIALDQRGHGMSQWSEDIAYSTDDHFIDLEQFIRLLDLENIIVVGHSMGGRNALFYGICAPERISRLILIDARPAWGRESSGALIEMIEALPPEVSSLEEATQKMQKVFPALTVSVCRHVVEYGYNGLVGGKFVIKVDMRMVDQVKSSRGRVENFWDLLKGAVPCALIVRGRQSSFLSRDEAKRMSILMPNARRVEIPNSSHLPHLENQAEFYRVVKDFLTLKPSVYFLD